MRVRNVALSVTALAWLVASCGGANGVVTVTGRLPVSTPEAIDREQSGMTSRSDSAFTRPTETVTTITADDARSGFEHIVARRIECGRDPWSCDLDRIAISGSPTRERLDHLLESRRAGGIVAGGGGAFRFRIDDVDIERGDLETEAVDVSVCVTDDTVLVDENGWVFDDGLFSGRMVFTMHRDDGEWLWFDDRTVTYVYGEDICGLAV